MKSKPWAASISFSAALLLTWGLSWSVKHFGSIPLLDLTVMLVGIAGNVVIGISNYIRGNELWAVRSGPDYYLYFLGNSAFVIGVLWPKTDNELEKYLLFGLRLPLFLLLVPIFWTAVGLRSLNIMAREGNFRTPLQMWSSLVNWLLGAPARVS